MRNCIRIIAFVLAAALLSAAVRGDRAQFMGGTVKSIPNNVQGTFSLEDKTALVFSHEKGEYRLPYDRITSMEFGQKVGRRVGATVALGVTTLGIGALPMLFSKKKKHYLTVGFKEQDGTNGAAIFELAKDIVRTTLPVLEARTGKKVEVEDVKGETKAAQSSKAATPAAAAETTAPAPTVPPVNVPAASGAVMTNADVMKLAASGVSQQIIINAVRNSQPQFNLTPSGTDQLLTAGVSEDVIKSMAARQSGR